MKIKINRLKVLSFTSLGVLGLTVVSTTVGCNPSSVPLQSNLADLSKQINNHKFTKEEVTLATDKNSRNSVAKLKKSITDSLTKKFKNEIASFDKIFKIEKVSLVGDKNELTEDQIEKFVVNDEKTLNVFYNLNNEKDPKIDNQFRIKITTSDTINELFYGSEDGFSIDKLNPEILQKIDLEQIVNFQNSIIELEENKRKKTVEVDELQWKISTNKEIMDFVQTKINPLSNQTIDEIKKYSEDLKTFLENIKDEKSVVEASQPNLKFEPKDKEKIKTILETEEVKTMFANIKKETDKQEVKDANNESQLKPLIELNNNLRTKIDHEFKQKFSNAAKESEKEEKDSEIDSLTEKIKEAKNLFEDLTKDQATENIIKELKDSKQAADNKKLTDNKGKVMAFKSKFEELQMLLKLTETK